MNIIEAARQVQKSGGKMRLIESGRFCPVEQGHVPIDVPHILSDDWEYIPPPPKTMKFMEAVAEMREGKKVRRLAWGKEELNYVICDGNLRAVTSLGQKSMLLHLCEVEATDWVVVEEGEYHE